MRGDSSGPNPGVVGISDAFQDSGGLVAGVCGLSAHTGVLGVTGTSGYAGVEGDGNNIGVQGVAAGLTGPIYGVIGRASGRAAATGVLGASGSYGVYGYCSGGGGAGVVASNTTNGVGLAAYNGGGGGYAAVFGIGSVPHSGNVLIEGTLTMLGGAPTTATRDAAGSLRRLHGLQTPESWIEDFGSAQLQAGSATVPLEPTFAALIETSGYHVFLTPEGDCNGLFVSAKSAGSFSVQELRAGTAIAAGGKPGAGGGTSGIPFSYRVVARRKNATSGRLDPVAEPPDIAPPPAPPEYQPAVKPGS